MEKFGNQLLSCVLKFSKEHNLSIGFNKPAAVKEPPKQSFPPQNVDLQQVYQTIAKLGPSARDCVLKLKEKQRISYVAFQLMNVSLEETALLR